jgi:hypothetical protein
MSSPKPPPSLEDQMVSLAAQMEKLAAAVAATQGDSAKIAKIADSLTTLQGNQGKLIVAVNKLQSEKISNTVIEKGSSSAGQTVLANTGDAIAHAAWHGHKLLFPIFDGLEDPLPWLNRCDQFFRIQETPEVVKVFLATFYMSGDAAQWYVLLERNHGQVGLRQARQPTIRAAAPQQPTWGADPATPRDHSGGIPEPILGFACTLRRLGGEASDPHLHGWPR